ncbi:MAG TPA: ATP-binding cassette domain-containing protein [Steroidobacteraceae bacterium]|nr:ATP-binding cassette domain-containing protein [Steroidobacteraceae bacterium]
MSAVEFHRVAVRLGGRAIFTDVDLSIEDAEFIGVLGPNGAGKTTLMRTILGLVTLAHGSIRVLGRAVERGNPAIGYLPQTRTQAAAARLSGRDFLASAMRGDRWGLPLATRAVRREVDAALDLVGAGSLARRPLAALSGGERQRLLLAQALLGRPRLLLLDEPLMSLDPRHQQEVVELVRRVQQQLQVAVLFSAHELNPLLSALDRVLYLGNGHAALGTVAEVINGAALSRLYGADIEVVRVNGRFFVMSGGHEVERDDHRHHV